jgi:hypothetical protein
MEAVRTSETSVDNHFTRQYNPEDSSEHHTRRRENLKSHRGKKTKIVRAFVYTHTNTHTHTHTYTYTYIYAKFPGTLLFQAAFGTLSLTWSPKFFDQAHIHQ